MNQALGKLLGLHRALWDYDTWYRYAWLVAPQAVSIAGLFLVLSDAGSPPTAPWVKPTQTTQRPAPQPNPDVPLCMNPNPSAKLRGEACDRLITAGRLTGAELAAAYEGRGIMKMAGQTDAAIADFTEALRLNPKSFSAYAARGSQYLNKDDLASAEKDIENAIEFSPGKSNAFALAQKAELLRRHKKLSDAQTFVTKALELQKDMEYAKIIQKNIEKDVEEERKRQQATVKPPSPPQPPRREDPTDKLRERAFAELQKGDNDMALALFSEVILSGNPISTDYSNRGTAYFNKRQVDLAMDDFNRAISMSSHTWYPHLKRGEILVQRGDYAGALNDFNSAIQQHAGKDIQLFYQRGRIYLRQQQWRSAQDDFDKVLELEPDYAEGYMYRGQAAAGNTRAVMERCQRDNQSGNRQTLIGGPCSVRMSFDGALADLRTAVAKKPVLGDAHYDIGRILADLDRCNEAVDAYSEAIRANANFSYAYNNRGVCYLKLNRRDRALADFSDAIRTDPRNKIAWTNRGEMRENARQRREAIDDFRQALAVDPQHAPARDGLRRLGVRQ
jgi:tetratricopeptide (TPR) repeat protein